ncbi:hypothetical protein AD998_10745 [bacterium 336/3]|nr:hypothetical protein AD998_10745 [bacterium 336/3]
MGIKSLLLNFLNNLGNNKRVKALLLDFIKKSENLGLSKKDIEVAQEFLDYGEYSLCFDTITEQLYEHQIHIDINYYNLAQKIALEMSLEEESYSYLKYLIQ